jgi:DNA-binding PadR family transcriptional regulator
MSLPHLLMGLIKDKPLSGYDLNKMFQHVISFFWTTDQSQIYRALYKLRDQGYVEIEYVAQEDNPDKKIYHLTEAGRVELRRWLAEVHELGPSRSVWLAQLFFGDEVTPADMIQLLEARIEQIRPELAELESRRRSWVTGFDDVVEDLLATHAHLKGEFRPFGAMTLDYGIQRYRFEIEWAEKAIEWIKQLYV